MYQIGWGEISKLSARNILLSVCNTSSFAGFASKGNPWEATGLYSGSHPEKVVVRMLSLAVPDDFLEDRRVGVQEGKKVVGGDQVAQHQRTLPRSR